MEDGYLQEKYLWNCQIKVSIHLTRHSWHRVLLSSFIHLLHASWYNLKIGGP